MISESRKSCELLIIFRKQTEKVESWEERNRKLYGLLITAMPPWLRTTLFNSHSGDGQAAITYLQSTFDAGEGKGNDHAYHLERLTRSVIEPRREIDEKDLQSRRTRGRAEPSAART